MFKVIQVEKTAFADLRFASIQTRATIVTVIVMLSNITVQHNINHSVSHWSQTLPTTRQTPMLQNMCQSLTETVWRPYFFVISTINVPSCEIINSNRKQNILILSSALFE